MKIQTFFIALLLLPMLNLHADGDPVLHQFEPKYADPYMVKGYYLLHIQAGDMEHALSQVIYFYENYGWGLAKPQKYSGISLIYEKEELPDRVQPFKTKIRTGALQKAMDFLTNKTYGTFRSNLFDNRVMVVRKQVNTLLYFMEIEDFEFSNITIQDALDRVLKSANRSTRKYNIRLEVPPVIHPREGYGPDEWVIYRGIRRDALQEKISFEINGHNLVDGLVEILKAQPIPYYLVLEKDESSEDYTHVLRFGTLPLSKLKKIERINNHRLYE